MLDLGGRFVGTAAGLAAMCVLSGCARGGSAEDWHSRTTPLVELAWDADDEVVVRQRGSKAVQWVVPAPSALPLRDFGTPERPQRTAALPDDVPSPMKDLVSAVPYLLGVTLEDRVVSPDGRTFTTTRSPTPFSGERVSVRGAFQLRVQDRRRVDEGDPFDTPDEASLQARFTDPAGNRYEVVLKQAVQPGIPGWRTGGGVLLDDFVVGGKGGTSPLEPRSYAHVLAWGIADVKVNGRLVDEDKLVRVMTAEVLDDAQEGPEMPLMRNPDGGAHETSLIVWPVRMTPLGPVHEPLSLPSSQRGEPPQSFIHVVFTDDRIVRAPPVAGNGVSR